MMKSQNKKRGFTIIELVIVVSVIAILSAVLIPTFAGVIKRAKLSSDQQAVRNMNVEIALVAEENMDLEQAMNILDEAGYNALDTLVPVSKNHAFFWDNANKTIVLVNTDNNTVVYPENYKTAFDSAWANLRDDGVKVISNLNTATADDLETALELGAKKVTLTKDIKVKNNINMEDTSTVIDLNGKTLDASKQNDRPFNVDGNASLTISGGTIEAGKYGLVNIRSGEATVLVENATITADLVDGALIKVRSDASANVTLNNVNYTDESNDSYIVSPSKGSNTITVNVNGGSYKAAYGFSVTNATITGATIETAGFGIEVSAGTATIKDCTIKTGSAERGGVKGGISAQNNAIVNVENCTMTSELLDFFVVNSGGAIIATGTYNNKFELLPLTEGVASFGYIKVNGVVVAGTEAQ